MKKKVLITLISIFSLSAWSRGGDETHNGGGITEQNIIHAWNALREFTFFCEDGECTPDQDAKEFMRLLAKNREAELQSGQILFVKASHHPDLFQDSSKLVATENKWGSLIYINKEALPQLDIHAAFGFLAVPLAAHAGIQNLHQIKSLEISLSEMASTRYSEASLKVYDQPQTRFMIWSFPQTSQVTLADNQKYINVTQTLSTAIPCPGSSVFTSLKVNRLSWNNLVTWDSENQIQDFSFQGDLSYDCLADSENQHFQMSFHGLIQAKITLNGHPEPKWLQYPESRVDFIPSSLQWIFSPARLTTGKTP